MLSTVHNLKFRLNVFLLCASLCGALCYDIKMEELFRKKIASDTHTLVKDRIGTQTTTTKKNIQRVRENKKRHLLSILFHTLINYAFEFNQVNLNFTNLP